MKAPQPSRKATAGDVAVFLGLVCFGAYLFIRVIDGVLA